jgi:predicted transcriptional regulator
MEHWMPMAEKVRREGKELGWSQETRVYETRLRASEISRLERGMEEPESGFPVRAALRRSDAKSVSLSSDV